jgi:hypothetical protein
VCNAITNPVVSEASRYANSLLLIYYNSPREACPRNGHHETVALVGESGRMCDLYRHQMAINYTSTTMCRSSHGYFPRDLGLKDRRGSMFPGKSWEYIETDLNVNVVASERVPAMLHRTTPHQVTRDGY